MQNHNPDGIAQQKERTSRSDIQVGDRIESNNCGFFTVLEKNGSYSVVKFDTGYVVTVDIDCVLSGQIKDPLYPP